MGDDTLATIPPGPLAPRREWFGLSTPIGMFGAIMAIVEIAFILSAIFVQDILLQWALVAMGAIGFFGNAIVFYLILIKKPIVLYGPGQYGGVTTIYDYASVVYQQLKVAQQRDSSIVTASAELSGGSDLTATAVESPEDQQATVSDTVSLHAEETVSVHEFNEGEYVTLVTSANERQSLFSSLDVSAPRGDLTKIVRYDPSEWIGQFLIDVSNAFRDIGYFTTPQSYGLIWVMRDRKSKRLLSDIGFVRDVSFGVCHTDYRRLGETDVVPGMVLEPVELPPPELPSPYLPLNPEGVIWAPATSPPPIASSFDEFVATRRRGRRTNAPLAPRAPQS